MFNEEIFRPHRWRWSRRDAKRVNARTDRDQNRRAHPPLTIKAACYDVGNDFLHLDAGAQHGLHLRHLAGAPMRRWKRAREQVFASSPKKARIAAAQRAELGCIWQPGSNYIHKTTGARLRAVALSRQQIRWRKSTTRNPFDFAYLNYVHVTGLYDRTASVGMARSTSGDRMTLSCVRSQDCSSPAVASSAT